MTTFLLAFEAGVGTLSVVNTNVVWWGSGLGSEAEDKPNAAGEENSEGVIKKTGRLLGLCESGPPMEIRVPELETVDWDRLDDGQGESLRENYGKWDPRGWKLARLQEVSRRQCMVPSRMELTGTISGLDDSPPQGRSCQRGLGLLSMCNVRKTLPSVLGRRSSWETPNVEDGDRYRESQDVSREFGLFQFGTLADWVNHFESQDARLCLFTQLHSLPQLAPHAISLQHAIMAT